MQGTDLRQGVRTLPVLYALRDTAGDADAVRLRELLGDGDLTDPALHAEALRLLRESPAVEEARQTVRTWVGEARDLLAQLPDLPCPGRLRVSLRLRQHPHRLTQPQASPKSPRRSPKRASVRPLPSRRADTDSPRGLDSQSAPMKQAKAQSSPPGKAAQGVERAV